MVERDDEALETFAEESEERLRALEIGLLALERTPLAPPAGLLDDMFRNAHSVKAGAGLLGLRGPERAAHCLENVLDRLRGGRLTASDDVVNALLQGVDLLRNLLGDGGDPRTMRQALAALQHYAHN